MKMLGCVIAMLIFTVIGTKLSHASECKVTNDKVIIGMVKDKRLPRYSINITNRHSESIIFFEVGNIAQKEIDITKAHVPVKYFAPPGWSGKHVFGYESEHMAYMWDASKDASILPGQTGKGFAIEFPASLDGIRKLSYMILFEQGECAAGQLQVQ